MRGIRSTRVIFAVVSVWLALPFIDGVDANNDTSHTEP